MSDAAPPRLTSLAHGGGCGCKLAPAMLQTLLAGQTMGAARPELLVGLETGDDAAVWRVDDANCVVATTDFFMPMVDDPRDFGAIAATNALSDVYAMGGTPIMALAVLGMPLGKLPVETVREILAGGAAICAQAGVPVAGGHSIDSPEPIYGLVAIGLCRPENVRRNGGAKPGDALILTKALGVGVYSAAFRKEALTPQGYAEMIASTTQLNRVGAALGREGAAHAVTDVTGFALLGHGLELARASGVTLRFDFDAIPFFADAPELARAGFVTGASTRNWASYGEAVVLPEGFEDWRRALLTDPQTSGGLLVACAPDAAARVLDEIRAAGFSRAAVVGEVLEGPPQARVA
ncbi:selenide, water dikinase SelD [Methylocella sp.]|uniref:selenide, water dikinase SelD n=1 Tax=Methylocella sp. TaxID=1978226 RepID=UPI0035AF9A3A